MKNILLISGLVLLTLSCGILPREPSPPEPFPTYTPEAATPQPSVEPTAGFEVELVGEQPQRYDTGGGVLGWRTRRFWKITNPTQYPQTYQYEFTIRDSTGLFLERIEHNPCYTYTQGNFGDKYVMLPPQGSVVVTWSTEPENEIEIGVAPGVGCLLWNWQWSEDVDMVGRQLGADGILRLIIENRSAGWGYAIVQIVYYDDEGNVIGEQVFRPPVEPFPPSALPSGERMKMEIELSPHIEFSSFDLYFLGLVRFD